MCYSSYAEPKTVRHTGDLTRVALVRVASRVRLQLEVHE